MTNTSRRQRLIAQTTEYTKHSIALYVYTPSDLSNEHEEAYEAQAWLMAKMCAKRTDTTSLSILHACKRQHKRTWTKREPLDR